MPVPQENLSFVERASCPFLRMVQHLSSLLLVYSLSVKSEMD
ncbi:hypothetical protein [Microcoleus sp. B13-B6]